MASPSLQLQVTRREPELITPAKPTPLQVKTLSDIDDQESLRYQVPFIHSYSSNVIMAGKDPVKVIRDAVAMTLVFYHPFAGRLREKPGKKLVVDCTGEGVIFIEANANVRLDQFGDTLLPPSPWLKELLYEVPGTGNILNCPLLLIQVTRLMCGGFIFAYRVNHTIADGIGVVQFMNAVAEIARGASKPSVEPVWLRNLLSANPDDPSSASSKLITCAHREYDEVMFSRHKHYSNVGICRMIHRNLFFSRKDIAVLKKLVPYNLPACSSFDILAAVLWRCRVMAHSLSPEDEVRLILAVTPRGKRCPQLVAGYYGNAVAFPAAITTAGKLCESPLSYALELVQKAKATVTDEYMKSLVNLLVTKGRPPLRLVRPLTFTVSETMNLGFREIDFGWGKAVNAGIAAANFEVSSIFMSYRNSNGDDGILVPLAFPAGPTMEKFEMEVQRMIREPLPHQKSNFHNKL